MHGVRREVRREVLANGHRAHAGATTAGQAQAIASLKKDSEWRDISARPVPAASGPAWSGFTGTSVTPQTITFAGQPVNELREQLASAQASFVQHRSFAGLACEHSTRL